MKIKFLGTGGVHGVPVWNCSCDTCTSMNKKNKRLRSSLMVTIGNKNIIIDFGPDFRQQLIKYKIKKIDYALLTHCHGDHMNDYMELSQQKNVKLLSSKQVLSEMYKRMGSSKDWLKTRNPSIQIISFREIKVGNTTIAPIKLEHQKDYIKTPVPCVGFIFQTKNYRFAYLSDYSKILESKKLDNLDLLISDGNGMKPKHGHVGVMGSVEVYKNLKPKKMLLTHIRHSTEHIDTTKFVKQFGNIEVAYDGLEIDI
ncbi:MAG: MBL fold metallo-hydrolase [Candidatus Magasanikbacteria bacterium]